MIGSLSESYGLHCALFAIHGARASGYGIAEACRWSWGLDFTFYDTSINSNAWE